jgi:hypothetical protein
MLRREDIPMPSMQWFAPDILQEAQGFTPAISGTAFMLGLLLWLLGWRGHRFWIVLVTTVSAGVWGLYSGPAFGTQYLVAGILLAVAAGFLALALVRVVAFAAGGMAMWILVRTIAPSLDAPLVFFLMGGLLGLLLFRLWTMALTSSAGALLMGYSGLCLANRLGNVDIVALAKDHPSALNAAGGALALLGLLAQFILERRRGRGKRRETRSKNGSGGHGNEGGGPGWNLGPIYRRAG